METYSFLRNLADSWFLLAMMLGFLGLCVWAFRPGSRKTHDELANSIFRNDDRPAEANPAKKEA
ncbi:MAG: CcoQ/FixQ family Cbb3-type cytochrome c oxidase assembly chaperone [Rhodobacter sp.]|nr:CcoQ/FixQ family Cbb3-type cytochrome c oxidase assembly chaperone [Rhodobacter sp.]